MRPIIFRAWLPEYETFVYSNKSSDEEWAEIWMFNNKNGVSVDIQDCVNTVEGGVTQERHIYVTPQQVVEQFTGLYDRNGKEIYEGDIVSIKNGNSSVFFELGCFYIKTVSNYRLGGCETRTIEVIGNIHEQKID